MACQPTCTTCARLRSAALRIIAERGTDALSHESLAEEAHVYKESVAVHYPVVASCLHEAYDEQASDMVRAVVAGYGESIDWQSGFERSRAQLIEWLVAHPTGARVFFVEALRGDRELRRRRDLTRRRIVEFLTAEYARSANGNGVPPLQVELLIGAGFRLISDAMRDGEPEQMRTLEHKLARLDGVFIPAPA
jgi:hypothetical protein